MDTDRIKGIMESIKGAAVRVPRSLQTCGCASANPPCQPCEDPGVLLAMVEVKDCEVIEVCSLVRKWVITPVALRYWLPEIGMTGRGLSLACCKSVQREYEESGKVREVRSMVTPMMRSLAALLKPEIDALMRSCLAEIVGEETAPGVPPGEKKRPR